MEGIKIPLLDLIIIVIYMLGILAVGILVVKKRQMTSSSYFLAGRSLNWALVGAALFASNISTIHLVGLASAGFEDGMVQGNFEWMATLLLVVLGLIFAPFYFKNKISTLPEFLEKRYSGVSRGLLAFLAIVGALFMHIGISLYAGAVVFENFFGISIWISIGIIALVTSIYTILGGLKAVVVTESIQTVILIIGAGIMAFLALKALPEHGVHSYADLKEAVKPDQLNLFRSYESNPKLPWYSLVLGYPIIGLWYWCADQTIVQRVLGARSLRDAQIGPIFAGFIKILPVFLLVVPGILAYVLFGDIINNLVKNGKIKAPIVIGRDHLDCGSVASPSRETENMQDGSDAIADWPLLNGLLNAVSGASWVSIHHGGGVGIGNAIHAGMVIVADGSKEMGIRLNRVLTNDPGTGIARHVDAGYKDAVKFAKKHKVKIPMMK